MRCDLRVPSDRATRTGLLFAIALAGSAVVPSGRAQTLLDERLTIQTVVSGLDQPTQIGFLDNGDFLACEKNTGRVRRVTNAVIGDTVLDLAVSNEAFRGLLGLAVHPHFPQPPWVYVFYSRAASDGGDWLGDRVSRFAWDGTRLAIESEQVLIDVPADPGQNLQPACEGGKLAFGPDDTLYAVIGDLGRGGFENPRVEANTHDAALAQAGAIFRIRDDGVPPHDNPFIDHPDPGVRRMFAYGVRNSFGLAFDPETGALWDAENGPELYDEVNLVRPGFNSGWLKIMGPDARDAAYEKNGFASYDPEQLVWLPAAHYSDPELSFLQTIGPTALTFLDGLGIPCDLHGRLVLGDTNLGNLYLLTLNPPRDGLALPAGLAEDRVADSPTERDALVWGSGWWVTSDLRVGPDGALYVVTLADGTVRRVRQAGPVGDLNGDARVDFQDLQLLLLAYGTTSDGDLDCDGSTDLADLSLLLVNWQG